MKRMKFCTKERHYTLESSCHGENTIVKEPPKYTPTDKYGEYRRKLKEEEYKEKGYL